jgi:hypothetical protein
MGFMEAASHMFALMGFYNKPTMPSIIATHIGSTISFTNFILGEWTLCYLWYFLDQGCVIHVVDVSFAQQKKNTNIMSHLIFLVCWSLIPIG